MLINFLSILRTSIVVTLCNAITGKPMISGTVEELLKSKFLGTYENRTAEVIAWEEGDNHGHPDYEKLLVYIDNGELM